MGDGMDIMALSLSSRSAPDPLIFSAILSSIFSSFGSVSIQPLSALPVAAKSVISDSFLNGKSTLYGIVKSPS